MNTVSSLLSMEKSLRQRLTQLNELKEKSTRVTIWEDSDKREEPTYNIKQIDTKCVKINRALFRIDSKIKESNAKTEISIEIDYDDLTSEID